MNKGLYKVAYVLAMASRRPDLYKQAGTARDVLDFVGAGTHAALLYKLLPVALAAAAGVGGGYALNRLSRHSDPSIADDGTKGEIKRVERLKRIQYYNALAQQLAAKNSKKDK